jgi:hypothetical protein
MLRLAVFLLCIGACVAPPPGTRTSDPVDVILMTAQTIAAYPEIVTIRHPKEIEARKEQVAPKGPVAIPEGTYSRDTFPLYGPPPPPPLPLR